MKAISYPERQSHSRNDSNLGAVVRDLVPDEWSTAGQTLSAINSAGGPFAQGGFQSLLGVTLPCLAGATIGWFFLPALSVEAEGVTSIAMAVMGALLAFGGLIVGFVVNLMLVTGKIERPDGMSYELMLGFSSRLRYLLASQATTLFASLLMSALAIAWMLSRACGASALSLHIIGTVLSAFTALVFLRMFLLPLQIYELHEASIGDALEKKRLETNEKIRTSSD